MWAQGLFQGWAWASWVPEHGSFPWDLPVLPSLGMLSSHFTLIWLQCYSNIPAEPLIPPFILGCRYWFSQVTLAVNKPPANAGDIRECRVQSLGREDLREEGMTTHSSILAWRIPWTEEPGRLQFIGSHTVRLDWSNLVLIRLRPLSWKILCHTTWLSCFAVEKTEA